MREFFFKLLDSAKDEIHYTYFFVVDCYDNVSLGGFLRLVDSYVTSIRTLNNNFKDTIVGLYRDFVFYPVRRLESKVGYDFCLPQSYYDFRGGVIDSIFNSLNFLTVFWDRLMELNFHNVVDSFFFNGNFFYCLMFLLVFIFLILIRITTPRLKIESLSRLGWVKVYSILFFFVLAFCIMWFLF